MVNRLSSSSSEIQRISENPSVSGPAVVRENTDYFVRYPQHPSTPSSGIVPPSLFLTNPNACNVQAIRPTSITTQLKAMLNRIGFERLQVKIRGSLHFMQRVGEWVVAEGQNSRSFYTKNGGEWQSPPGADKYGYTHDGISPQGTFFVKNGNSGHTYLIFSGENFPELTHTIKIDPPLREKSILTIALLGEGGNEKLLLQVGIFLKLYDRNGHLIHEEFNQSEQSEFLGVSSDSKHIFTMSPYKYSRNSPPVSVQIWTFEESKLVKGQSFVCPYSQAYYIVCVPEKTKYFYTLGEEDVVYRREFLNPNQPVALTNPLQGKEASRLSISPDGSLCAVATKKHGIILQNLTEVQAQRWAFNLRDEFSEYGGTSQSSPSPFFMRQGEEMLLALRDTVTCGERAERGVWTLNVSGISHNDLDTGCSPASFYMLKKLDDNKEKQDLVISIFEYLHMGAMYREIQEHLLRELISTDQKCLESAAPILQCLGSIPNIPLPTLCNFVSDILEVSPEAQEACYQELCGYLEDGFNHTELQRMGDEVKMNDVFARSYPLSDLTVSSSEDFFQQHEGYIVRQDSRGYLRPIPAGFFSLSEHAVRHIDNLYVIQEPDLYFIAQLAGMDQRKVATVQEFVEKQAMAQWAQEVKEQQWSYCVEHAPQLVSVIEQRVTPTLGARLALLKDDGTLQPLQTGCFSEYEEALQDLPFDKIRILEGDILEGVAELTDIPHHDMISLEEFVKARTLKERKIVTERIIQHSHRIEEFLGDLGQIQQNSKLAILEDGALYPVHTEYFSGHSWEDIKNSTSKLYILDDQDSLIVSGSSIFNKNQMASVEEFVGWKKEYDAHASQRIQDQQEKLQLQVARDRVDSENVMRKDRISATQASILKLLDILPDPLPFEAAIASFESRFEKLLKELRLKNSVSLCPWSKEAKRYHNSLKSLERVRAGNTEINNVHRTLRGERQGGDFSCALIKNKSFFLTNDTSIGLGDLFALVLCGIDHYHNIENPSLTQQHKDNMFWSLIFALAECIFEGPPPHRVCGTGISDRLVGSVLKGYYCLPIDTPSPSQLLIRLGIEYHAKLSGLDSNQIRQELPGYYREAMDEATMHYGEDSASWKEFQSLLLQYFKFDYDGWEPSDSMSTGS